MKGGREKCCEVGLEELSRVDGSDSAWQRWSCARATIDLVTSLLCVSLLSNILCGVAVSVEWNGSKVRGVWRAKCQLSNTTNCQRYALFTDNCNVSCRTNEAVGSVQCLSPRGPVRVVLHVVACTAVFTRFKQLCPLLDASACQFAEPSLLVCGIVNRFAANLANAI